MFLFEQLVIFSEPIDKKKGLPLPGYTFKNSIKVSPRPRSSRPPPCCPVFAASVLRPPPQVSCLGVEELSEEPPGCLVLTSRGTDGGVARFVMQAASPEIKQAWFEDVVQILETQRNFLNGARTENLRFEV